ncbi:MAG: PAS domain-containing protein, partial [Candidatus Eremiobacteraeota bacterium]|nr:PAS domain-containing protein [Candidatus Eremiobacteraeota bacterium]
MPYIVLFPVIALVSLFEGIGPGILSTLLGLTGVLHWYAPPRGSFIAGDPKRAILSGLIFLTACGLIIASGEVARRVRTKLERSRVLFETFLDNSPSVAFLKDMEGRYVYLNKAGRERHGADFAGKKDLDLVDASTAAQWHANDQIVLRKNAAGQFVETTEEGDGKHTWLTVLFPLTDADGRRLLGGKATDITAQRRAEEEVQRLQQESAQRAREELNGMKRLLEIAARCMRAGDEFQQCLDAILDASIEFTGADKGHLQLLDEKSGALRINAQRGFEEPFLNFFADSLQEVSARGMATNSKQRVIVDDVRQSKILVGTSSVQVLLDAGVLAVQSTPLVSSSGTVLGIISTHYAEPRRPGERELHLMDLLARQAADYLERKQNEAALAATMNQLQRFLAAAPTGLTHCSRDLRYLEVNAAYAAMAGLPAEQIVGRSIVEVMGAKGWEGIRPYVERVLRGERVEYEATLPYAAGGNRHIHVVYMPEINGEHGVAGWFASVADTTQLKQAEEKLQHIERMAAAGQLAATLAHEINNPLMSVTNLLYLLEHQPGLDPTMTALITTAGAEIARVSRIVKQSLSYYRSGTRAVEVDLAAVVGESLEIFAARLDKAGVEVRKKIAPGTLVPGYPDELRQVVDNLLLNALEAMRKGGQLVISVRHATNWKRRRTPAVRMTVADNGPGIPGE